MITLIAVGRESSGYLGVQSIIVIGDSEQEPAEAGPDSYQGCRPTTRPGEQGEHRRWQGHGGEDVTGVSLAPPHQDQGLLTSDIL